MYIYVYIYILESSAALRAALILLRRLRRRSCCSCRQCRLAWLCHLAWSALSALARLARLLCLASAQCMSQMTSLVSDGGEKNSKRRTKNKERSKSRFLAKLVPSHLPPRNCGNTRTPGPGKSNKNVPNRSKNGPWATLGCHGGVQEIPQGPF